MHFFTEGGVGRCKLQRAHPPARRAAQVVRATPGCYAIISHFAQTNPICLAAKVAIEALDRACVPVEPLEDAPALLQQLGTMEAAVAQISALKASRSAEHEWMRSWVAVRTYLLNNAPAALASCSKKRCLRVMAKCNKSHADHDSNRHNVAVAAVMIEEGDDGWGDIEGLFTNGLTQPLGD